MTINPYAILLAAGTGKRAGLSMPKQLAKIKNREIILHSLDIFATSGINFGAIIITVPPLSSFNFDWKNFFKEKTPADVFDKIRIVTGGKERQDSVFNSVSLLSEIIPEGDKDDTVVFIHDSARPFVLESEIKSLLDTAQKSGASFLCSFPAETIKEITPESAAAMAVEFKNNPLSRKIPLKLKTHNRNNLISAKTPQVFKFNIIKNAFDLALKQGFISTDDISLAENMGLSVIPLLSSDYNIKITTALDLEIANYLFEKFKADNR